MAQYTQHKNLKDNKHYWSLQAYLGTDNKTGKRIRVSRRRDGDGKLMRTKKQARDEVERLQQAFDNGAFDKHKKSNKREVASFEGWATEWLEKRYEATVQDSTYLATKDMFFDLHILPRLGDYKIEKIDKVILDGVISEWYKSLSKHRYKLVVNYTKKVFQYAVESGAIRMNPLLNVHVPIKKDKPKRPTQFYDKHELNTFLEACSDYGDNGKFWHMFFHFLAYTGLRKGEALALIWDDVDFEGSCIDVNKTTATRMGPDDKRELVVHDMTKNGEHRVVTIDGLTSSLLKKYKLSQPKRTELIFPALRDTARHMHGQSANKAMRSIIKQNELKAINTHELRHTHCSLLFEAGVSMKEVQQRLGHKDIAVTMNVYAHVTQLRSNEVAELFAGHVNDTQEKRRKTQKNAHPHVD